MTKYVVRVPKQDRGSSLTKRTECSTRTENEKYRTIMNLVLPEAESARARTTVLRRGGSPEAGHEELCERYRLVCLLFPFLE